MFGTLLAIAALFGVLAFVIAKVDELAFLAPKRTKGITGSAATYRHACTGIRSPAYKRHSVRHRRSMRGGVRGHALARAGRDQKNNLGEAR